MKATLIVQFFWLQIGAYEQEIAIKLISLLKRRVRDSLHHLTQRVSTAATQSHQAVQHFQHYQSRHRLIRQFHLGT
jgi:hypothetical protein